MRSVRLLLATTLAISASAALAAAPAQAAPTPPFTAVTAAADPVYGGGSPIEYDGAAVSVSTPTTAGLAFHTTATDPSRNLEIDIAPPTGQALQESDYTTARMATADAAQLSIVEGSSDCGTAAGTLHVRELVASGTDITAFAADYTFSCDGHTAVSGQLRFASSVDYAAVLPNTTSWDFASQLVKKNGWTKSFVFANRGSADQSFAAPTLSNTKSFSITTNTCQFPVPAGGSCLVSVTPHPQGVLATTNQLETGTLTVAPLGLPALQVPLRVGGIATYPFYAIPGPQRITVNWDRLPGPIDSYSVGTRIYRGTSPSSLAYFRGVTAGYVHLTDSTVVAGRTYYYAIRPKFEDGSYGDLSPVVAARAWPKYSAGMYHRLTTPVRFVGGHRVSAGSVYSLRVLGIHGVPGSHVSAVALNVTAASSTAATSVYVYPYGTGRPAAADIAVRAHDTRSNFVLAKVGSSGRIAIATTHGSVPVNVDVFGYFSGSGLSSSYGMGGALHEYGYPGTILDTKGWRYGAIKHDYYANAPVNFDAVDTRHVTSLLVEVTAYGSTGSGSITGFSTNTRPSGTSVLSYRANTTTSAAAIIRAGRWYGSNDQPYPSVSFLNRGAKPVQLIVTILGFFDDNTFVYGQRYVPTAPVHLLASTMYTGSNRTIVPGRNANYWTSAFNEKLSATRPSAGTTVALHGIGLGAAPARGQLHAPAHVTTVSSTIGVTGVDNKIGVHNAAGTVRVDVWSFGRFQMYPTPSMPNYASATPSGPSYVQSSAAAVPPRQVQQSLR